jgi:hypothetical protein
MFYLNNKKIVPSNIGDFLNARALAFWIMDDGSWAGSGVLLHCNNFTLSDVKLLANVLKESFNLRVTVRVKGENHILYIHAESIKLLISLVKQYIRPEFLYKLGIKTRLLLAYASCASYYYFLKICTENKYHLVLILVLILHRFCGLLQSCVA